MYTGGCDGVSRIRNAALLGVELSHVSTNFRRGARKWEGEKMRKKSTLR